VTVALFGERYASSAPYLALLSLGFYVNAAAGFNAELLQAAGRVRRLVVANVVTIVVHTTLVLVLAYRLGALGVAVATAVALVVQNAINQTGVRAVLGMAIPRPLARVYLTVVLATVLLGAVQMLAGLPLIGGLVLTVLATAVVLRVTRDVLRLGEAFPVLSRLPVARSVVAGEAGADSSTPRTVSAGRRRRRPTHRRRTARRRR
jgi:O-antigen/teichoic acid export membrane protein